MARNARNRPLCKHARAADDRVPGMGEWMCTWWCEWRMLTYWTILPSVVVVGLLLLSVPMVDWSGLQYHPLGVEQTGP